MDYASDYDDEDAQHTLTPVMKAKKAEALGRVAAYSSLAVIASLVFGFAVSVLFEFADEEIIDDLNWQYPFCILMCIVLVCNAYAMVVMTFNYYVVYRFVAENRIDEALLFMRKCSKYRRLARIAFRAGLFLFLICAAIFLESRIDTLNAIICAIILISGTIIIAMTIRYMLVAPTKIAQHVAKTREMEQRLGQIGDQMAVGAMAIPAQQQTEHMHVAQHQAHVQPANHT